jgi:hypothetical protein
VATRRSVADTGRVTLGDRLRRLDERTVGGAEQCLAGTGEPGSWYGGRRMRLAVGVLGILAATYDIVIVAVGAASTAAIVPAPLMLVFGLRLTWSAVTDTSGGAK